MGYSNVYVYREGIPGWIKAGYPVEKKVTYPKVNIPLVSPDELAQMDPSSVFILDVRSENDFAKGHIKGAHNIYVEKLPEMLDQIPKDKKIILVDTKGKLTRTVGRYLISKGFKDVARLDGGYNAWRRQGLPVE